MTRVEPANVSRPSLAVVHAAVAIAAVASLVSSAVYLRAELHMAGHAGFPLDDAWIHAQYARRLATGHGFSYAPGVEGGASTAPLWTILLAGTYWLTGGPIVGAKLFGTLFLVGLAVMSAVLVARLGGDGFAQAVGGVAVALSPRLAWSSLSGMEVPLYCFLAVAGLVAHLAHRRETGWHSITGTLLIGLAVASRPELAILLLSALADRVIIGARLGWTGRDQLLDAGRHLATAAATLMPFGLIGLLHGGRPLPGSFYAKAGAPSSITEAAMNGWLILNHFLYWLHGQSPILFVMALVGALVLLDRLISERDGSAALLLALGLTPVAVGALTGGISPFVQEARRILHLLVFAFVIGAVGLSWLRARLRHRWIVALVGVAAIGQLLSQDVRYAPRYGVMVKSIDQMQVEIGRWLDRHTPPGATVAVNDAGAIEYFSQRPLIDLYGLMTPDAIPYRLAGRSFEFLAVRRPAYVVIFPDWFPDVAARADVLHELYRVPADLAAVHPMVVYHAEWPATASSGTRASGAPASGRAAPKDREARARLSNP